MAMPKLPPWVWSTVDRREVLSARSTVDHRISPAPEPPVDGQSTVDRRPVLGLVHRGPSGFRPSLRSRAGGVVHRGPPVESRHRSTVDRREVLAPVHRGPPGRRTELLPLVPVHRGPPKLLSPWSTVDRRGKARLRWGLRRPAETVHGSSIPPGSPVFDPMDQKLRRVEIGTGGVESN